MLKYKTLNTENCVKKTRKWKRRKWARHKNYTVATNIISIPLRSSICSILLFQVITVITVITRISVKVFLFFYQQRFSFKGGKSFYSYKSLLSFKGSSYQFLMVFYIKTCFGLKGAYDFHLHSIRTKDCQKQSPRGFLRNFAKFTGKHLCQSLFFNKVVGWSLQFY